MGRENLNSNDCWTHAEVTIDSQTSFNYIRENIHVFEFLENECLHLFGLHLNCHNFKLLAIYASYNLL